MHAAHWLQGSHVLRLGPAEGIGTRVLLRHSKQVKCVEGSELITDQLQSKHVPGKAHCSNAKLESINDVNLVKSSMKLGISFPEISAELLAVIEA